MNTITLVAEARLYLKDNRDLYDYFDDYSKFFSFLLRRTIHHLRHKLNGQKESEYRSQLMLDYNISNRTAKALLKTAKNYLKLHKEAMKYLFNKTKKKRNHIRKEITIVKRKLDKKERAYLKKKLFHLQMKLNHLNQILSKGIPFQLTLGTKKFLKSDKERFLTKRDNQFVYMGDKNETKGNQQFQITYDSKKNQFAYKTRYDNDWIKDSKYFYGSFVLKNKKAKESIRKILSNPKSAPLTYRVIKKGKYLYLQIMYRKDVRDHTRDAYGVIGVDFNKGFISTSEIDETGKMLSLKRYYYRPYGSKNQTSNSMFKMISELVKQAKQVGKDIVIEDLTSLDQKKVIKSRFKNYNRMLHSLKFGRFKELLTRKCLKEGVGLHFVNPYNTSKIAKDSYCESMKLNVHDGASFVIARRYFEFD